MASLSHHEAFSILEHFKSENNCTEVPMTNRPVCDKRIPQRLRGQDSAKQSGALSDRFMPPARRYVLMIEK
jgi:hypothetical protein